MMPPGSVLYMPRGTPHKVYPEKGAHQDRKDGEATDALCVHYTISVRAEDASWIQALHDFFKVTSLDPDLAQQINFDDLHRAVTLLDRKNDYPHLRTSRFPTLSNQPVKAGKKLQEAYRALAQHMAMVSGVPKVVLDAIDMLMSCPSLEFMRLFTKDNGAWI